MPRDVDGNPVPFRLYGTLPFYVHSARALPRPWWQLPSLHRSGASRLSGL